jgi:plasmid replication initiation protein
MAESKDSKTIGHLVPQRHHQMDFFVADILDAAPKGDTASMEHPLFALKAGDKRIRVYARGDVTVTVKPGYDGCATIHDKDLWIYCISQLVEAINRGREVGRVVRFTAYDFLINTNRDTSGRAYLRMADMLGRLKGTVIETNIETEGQRERRGFGLVDSWRVVERDGQERMVAVEVTLPEWLFRSVQAMQVVTLSRDYFRLRKPLDRRIYELARKHCGQQPKWRVGLAILHEKSGSTAPLRNFRGDIKKLAASNELPDYRMEYDAGADAVTFYSRGEKGHLAQFKDITGKDYKPRRVGSFQRI